MNAELAAALAALEPEYGPPQSEPIALAGGITNRNFKIRLDGRDVVVRLPGKDTELLGIDRAAEHDNAVAAYRAGVGAEVEAVPHGVAGDQPQALELGEHEGGHDAGEDRAA